MRHLITVTLAGLALAPITATAHGRRDAAEAHTARASRAEHQARAAERRAEGPQGWASSTS